MTDVKQRILEAAKTLYGEDGAAGLSMRKVAKQAGVSAMASYRHFESKEQLMHHLQVHGFSLYAQLQAEIGDDVTGWDRVVANSTAYGRFALRHPAYFRIAFMATDELGTLKTLTPEGQRIIEGTFRFSVAAMLGAGVPPEQATLETVRHWAHIHGLVALHLAGRLRFHGDDFEAFFASELAFLVEQLQARFP